MVVKWQDKVPVSILSTIHDSIGMTSTIKTNRKTGEAVIKPEFVTDYNKGMGGVDKKEQLASYPVMHCYSKGYKILFYILHTAFLNSHVLYKKVTNRRTKYNQFRVMSAEQLTEEAVI
jgi:hypothetical protein